MNRIEFHAMGSRMLAVVDNPSPAAKRALSHIPDWFEEWEQVLSRFRFDSELFLLNHSEGKPVAVSETLGEVFKAALQADSFTGGLVRATVLDALLQAGYDRSFDQMFPDQVSALPAVLDLPGSISSIPWDEATYTLSLPESVHLDFGGVAKGWAAQKAVNRLKDFGPALVDAGGDIAISGPLTHGDPWAIGIRDPFHPDRNLETLRLMGGGVATSGTDYHRWQQGGAWHHHLIDPATGLPADSDVLAATVIAPDALLAEAAAKALVLLGSRAGMEWLEADSTLAGAFVLHSGDTLYSQRMQAYIWR